MSVENKVTAMKKMKVEKRKTTPIIFLKKSTTTKHGHLVLNLESPVQKDKQPEAIFQKVELKVYKLLEVPKEKKGNCVARPCNIFFGYNRTGRPEGKARPVLEFFFTTEIRTMTYYNNRRKLKNIGCTRLGCITLYSVEKSRTKQSAT